MKASVKFREDEQKKPLLRAKVPLTVLGLPFQSGVVAGESKELALSLSTFFESGPSIKIAYRPNDTWNPFSLVVRTGTGTFGSPVSSSLLMSAEFNLVGGKGSPNPNPSPRFMLHFKPRFGDFSVKKSQSSDRRRMGGGGAGAGSGSGSDEDGSIDVVDAPGVETGFYGRKIAVLPAPAAGAIAGALSGMEVAARTKLPVRSQAVVNFRWGLKFPGAGRGGDLIGGIDLRRIPFLVMNKIGIEHVGGGGNDSKMKEATELGNGEVGDICLMMKQQLEGLQSENGMLRKAVDDLRQDMNAGRWGLPVSSPVAGEWGSGSVREGERSRGGGKADRRSGGEKRATEGDVNEELKKALKGAAGGGGGGIGS